MKSKPVKNVTPVSQVSREEARKLVEKMVTDWLQDRDDEKALALFDKAGLCIEDAKRIEAAERTKKLN